MTQTMHAKWVDKEQVIDEIYYALDDQGDGDLMDQLGVFDTVYPIWEEVLDDLGVDEEDLYEGAYGDVEFVLFEKGMIDVRLKLMASKYLQEVIEKKLIINDERSFDQQVKDLMEEDNALVEEAFTKTKGEFVRYDIEGIKNYMKSFIKDLV